jgi:hypothetical protein
MLRTEVGYVLPHKKRQPMKKSREAIGQAGKDRI